METKEQFKKRLKREGRWDEFIKLREGLKRDELSPKEAWAKARREFEPDFGNQGLDATVADLSDGGDSGLDSGDGISRDIYQNRPNVTARAVVQWVFDHIDVADVRPEDAPSSGAWNFLQRVRTYPELLKEFYRSISQWSKTNILDSTANHSIGEDAKTEQQVRLEMSNRSATEFDGQILVHAKFS
ncbi:hypothetical protein [Anaerohalosphaera lusitana]|uniref:hypothetical protein n=1 Tax=Anaerohalosphaera lusitana TaxID=1936003 RepID=UPI0011BA8E44|nr:hypothetical protein [Anaerohalosphaera lusitana]